MALHDFFVYCNPRLQLYKGKFIDCGFLISKVEWQHQLVAQAKKAVGRIKLRHCYSVSGVNVLFDLLYKLIWLWVFDFKVAGHSNPALSYATGIVRVCTNMTKHRTE